MKSIFLTLTKNFMLSVFAMTISTASIASMPIPDALALDEYIERYTPMIFVGEFRGMVHISKELYEKLKKPEDDIDPRELILSSGPSPASGGDSFMELRDLKLIYAPKNARIKSCEYSVGYQGKNILLEGGGDFDIYHRNLIGKRLILFLRGPGKYGRGASDFPGPLFFSAGGVNWRDGAPLPESRLDEVQKVAQKLNLIKIKSNDCDKGAKDQ